MSAESPPRFTATQWLIVAIAAIGFLFDTYELLMTPLVGVPAIAELLQVPPNNPLVTVWTGRMLWMSALCGGVFGLLGGWLIDRFGRKRIMAASIFVYRRRLSDVASPYRVPGYPWTPLLFILAAAALVINTIVTQPIRAGLGLGVVLLGAPVYFIWRSRKSTIDAVESK